MINPVIIWEPFQNRIMTQTLHAVVDNGNLKMKERLIFSEGQRVIVNIDLEPKEEVRAYSFFDLAEKMNLKGPEYWSENHQDYASGVKKLVWNIYWYIVYHLINSIIR